MKYLSIILLVGLSMGRTGEGLYACKNAKISLYSSAPIEDIKAASTAGASVFNASTGELDFSVAMLSFQFQKSLMQEHFNSDYMESDKYPRSTFKGKIEEHIDVTKDGIYPVKVTGELTVHGVSQSRTIPGTITIKSGEISMMAEFMVKCADHHIEIPRLVFHNIAESIKINVSATYKAH